MSSSIEAAPEKRDPQSKAHHIDVCLSDASKYVKASGFDALDFVNCAVPEVSLQEIDTRTTLVGKRMNAPLMVAPMTGGVERAHVLNRRLAAAAERFGLAMGVGSQRVGIEDEVRAAFFKVRADAPTIPLFANFGGAQLAKGWGVEQAKRAVAMIEADALFLHLNPIQEAAQGGDVDFRGLLSKIASLIAAMQKDNVPVFVREVGFGLSEAAARALLETGVAGLDCAGAGGTSWSKVEALCAKTERRRKLGERFSEWGIPTTVSIREVRRASATIPLIATGGLRHGVDVAKAVALGADVGAMARCMLVAADAGEAQLHEFIDDVIQELRVTMFGIGAGSLAALRGTPALVSRSGA